MSNTPKKHRKKIDNPRHFKLLKAIGYAFSKLRKGAGYSSSEKFANVKTLNRGMYGKYEAGSVDMKVTTLLDLAIAHGLSEKDVFNADFLKLGQADDENSVSKIAEERVITQVRHQLKILIGEVKANEIDDDNILEINNILTKALSQSKKKALFEAIGLSSKTPRFEERLNLLISLKWIAMTHPENLNHPRQKYYTTEAGKEVLRLKQDGEENENS